MNTSVNGFIPNTDSSELSVTRGNVHYRNCFNYINVFNQQTDFIITILFVVIDINIIAKFIIKSHIKDQLVENNNIITEHQNTK